MAEPIGIKIPIGLGNTGYFDQTYFSIEEVKSNLYNLILTQKSERIMQPDFGTDVYKILFEPIDSGLKDRVQDSIESAISTWLPYVQLNGVDIVITDENIENNTIDIKINYSLARSLNEYDEIIVTFAL